MLLAIVAVKLLSKSSTRNMIKIPECYGRTYDLL